MLLKLTPAFSVEKPHKLPKLIFKKKHKKNNLLYNKYNKFECYAA